MYLYRRNGAPAYTGETGKSMEKRHSEHLKNPRKWRTHFDKVLQKYSDEFTYEILVVVATKQEALDYEVKFAEHFNTMHPNGLNHKVGGTAFVFSDDARRRIGEKITGRKHRPDTLLKMSAWQKNVPKTPEAVEKVAAALRGKPKSELHRANLSKSLTRWFKLNGCRRRKGTGRPRIPIDKEKVLAMVSAGVHYDEISKVVGASERTIRARLKEWSKDNV